MVPAFYFVNMLYNLKFTCLVLTLLVYVLVNLQLTCTI